MFYGNREVELCTPRAGEEMMAVPNAEREVSSLERPCYCAVRTVYFLRAKLLH